MSLLLLNKDDNASLTAKSSKQLTCLVDSDLDSLFFATRDDAAHHYRQTSKNSGKLILDVKFEAKSTENESKYCS